MTLKIALSFALAIFALAARAEKIALINGTLINPGTSQIVQNATVVINGDRIEAAGDAKTVSPAVAGKDAQVIDCKGKFILPGTSTRTFTSFSRAICSRGRTLSILRRCGRTARKWLGSKAICQMFSAVICAVESRLWSM